MMPDVIRVCPIPILFVGLFFICLICSCIFLTLSESAGFHLKNKKERKKRTTVYEKCHSSVVVLLSSPVLCSYIFISIPTHLLQNFHWSFLMFWFHFYPPSLSLSLSLSWLFYFSFHFFWMVVFLNHKEFTWKHHGRQVSFYSIKKFYFVVSLFKSIK